MSDMAGNAVSVDSRCTRCTTAEIQMLKIGNEHLAMAKVDKDGQTTWGVIVANICPKCIAELQKWLQEAKPRIIVDMPKNGLKL